MIGPILIAVSWFLLRLERKSLDVLGFNFPLRRLREFSLGFAVTGAAVIIQQLALSAASGVDWIPNEALTSGDVVHKLRVNVNSVLFEELVFRGYLFYQLLRRVSEKRGILIGAAAFGVYHWFSYGAFGNPVMMLFVLLYTGAFGYMLCAAFAQTRSLAAPIGLHLGWNLISYLVFSGGPYGPGLFVTEGGVELAKAGGTAGFALNMLFPMALVAGVSWFLYRRLPSAAGLGREYLA